MRHFSLIKLLSVSSFSVSGTSKGLTTTTTTPIDSGSLQLPAEQQQQSRREIMKTVFGGATSMAFVAASPTVARALDMDAFVNAQLDEDTKNCDPKRDPKCKPALTKDEALCKYGQSGDARGEACKRFKEQGGKLPSAAPQGKSLGGAYAM